METTKTMKWKGKQIKVETGKQKTDKNGYIIKVERFEILCEDGKIVSVLEDLDELFIQISPVRS